MKKKEEHATDHLGTQVNKILLLIFSNVEAYINNQQFHKSNRKNAHNSYISKEFRWTISEYKVTSLWEVYAYEKHWDEIIDSPLFELFFSRKLKLLCRIDDFMLYDKLVIDFFSIFVLLYQNMNLRLGLIRSRPKFYMINNNPNFNLGIVNCSLQTRHIAMKDKYHRKKIESFV